MSLLLRTVRFSSHSLFHRRSLSVLRAAFHSSAEAGPTSSEGRTGGGDGYPSGQFELERFGAWKRCAVKLRMFIAGVVMPWQRVRQGSVLQMHLRGQIPEQLKSHFSSGLSLPQICENFMKAAYDPRISGIYLHIGTLGCGWAKVEEIRRHIFNFKKSGKFIVGYAPRFREKEYYLGCACEELYAPPSADFALYGLTVQAPFFGGVLEKIGIEPQVERIGKYKTVGDILTRKDMSEETRQMLTSLLDSIYGEWLNKVSSTKGKKQEDIESFINEGVYEVGKLKEDGWITDIKYDDEVISLLVKRLGLPDDKSLPIVDYRNYSRVNKWTLGLSGGKDKIAIIRASGSISHSWTRLTSHSSGIVAEQFIQKIRSIRVSKRYKAVIIRIDSPGGDALASDLMWREIRCLAATTPVIASMSDKVASGGYYMAMAARTIVAENLTLTGSIGVVKGKLNLGELYGRMGFNKINISRGKYAELIKVEQRPFRPDEAELFTKSAEHVYNQFRDKAAYSRSMTVDEMEELAQGRVWTGKQAASKGLVDVIGGLSRAVAIAKHMANIPQNQQVTLVELSRPSPTLPEVLSSIWNSVVAADETLHQLADELTPADEIQARMDGIAFQSRK